MKTTRVVHLLQSLIRKEDGQILPWMFFLTILFVGMAGLTLDLGRAYVCYSELQASTDAAALSGSYAMGLSGATMNDFRTGSVDIAVTELSAQSGSRNYNPNLSNASITDTGTCKPISSFVPLPCGASDTGKNVLVVTQTADVPTFFIRALTLFGVNSAATLHLTTTSTATLVGSANNQFNVAIIVDSTKSMADKDSSSECNGQTKEACALGANGVQALLQSLTPCTTGSVRGNCIAAYDTVSLFTYPPVQGNTVKYDTSCSKGTSNWEPYTVPAVGATYTKPNYNSSTPTYQLTGYLSDYSYTNQPNSTLDPSSALSIAAGAASCNSGLQAVGIGTYFASVIYAAQSSLVAQQKLSPGSQNAMIILSDGDANSYASFDSSAKVTANGANYPSTQDECQQAIKAANYATSNGTTVYTVAYGSSNDSSTCNTDTQSRSNPTGTGVKACQTMQQMASSDADFFSDTTSSTGCTSGANSTIKDLKSIFKQIAYTFTRSRLIPNSVAN